MGKNSQQARHSYGFILLDKFNLLSLSSLTEPLRIANYCSGSNLYQWHFLSADGAEVSSSAGVTIRTQPVSTEDANWEAIIVCGGWNAERYESSELFRWLQHKARSGVKLGATETGAYVLARVGLLQGYRVTVHWHCHNAFRERYPGIDLLDALYVIDRQRMTCAGGTAGLDMMLENLRNKHGEELAMEVANQLLRSRVRKGHRQQKNLESRQQSAHPPALQRAIKLMESNIERPLTIPQISEELGFSQRKLERLFKKHFDCSAVAFYRTLRLQEARVLLTHTDMSVLDICIACGFASSSYFSKSYTRLFGVRPRDHRTSWPETEPEPFWPGISRITAVKSGQASREGDGPRPAESSVADA